MSGSRARHGGSHAQGGVWRSVRYAAVNIGMREREHRGRWKVFMCRCARCRSAVLDPRCDGAGHQRKEWPHS